MYTYGLGITGDQEEKDVNRLAKAYEHAVPSSSLVTVTAEWARKESVNIKTQKILKEIKLCEEAITSATKTNGLAANMFINLDELTINELRSRGFKVTLHDGDPRDPRENDYITISW
jgi:hypothetical protein